MTSSWGRPAATRAAHGPAQVVAVEACAGDGEEACGLTDPEAELGDPFVAHPANAWGPATAAKPGILAA